MISFIYCNTSSIKLSPIKKLSFEQEYNIINNMFPSIKDNMYELEFMS